MVGVACIHHGTLTGVETVFGRVVKELGANKLDNPVHYSGGVDEGRYKASLDSLVVKSEGEAPDLNLLMLESNLGAFGATANFMTFFHANAEYFTKHRVHVALFQGAWDDESVGYFSRALKGDGSGVDHSLLAGFLKEYPLVSVRRYSKSEVIVVKNVAKHYREAMLASVSTAPAIAVAVTTIGTVGFGAGGESGVVAVGPTSPELDASRAVLSMSSSGTAACAFLSVVEKPKSHAASAAANEQ